MIGRTILSNNQINPTRVSSDGQPLWKTGGITIDWNTVVAPVSNTTLADGSIVLAGKKFLRYGQTMTKITLAATNVITITGTPTGGTYAVSVTTPNGTVTTAQTTTAIAYNASAATLQAALEALSNVGTGNAVVSGSGYAVAEVDTFTPATPTAGDTITITNAAGVELVSIVVGATPSATTITTQLKQAWNTNPVATALATASGTATFIVTAVTPGVTLALTPNISGTGTFTKAITTPATLPFTVSFANALGPVTMTSSGALLTGGTSPAATTTAPAPGGNFGWFGPYDPAATDGRATQTRGEAVILDQTVLEYGAGASGLLSAVTNHVGGIEGGSVWYDRLLQSGVATHTLAAGPTFAELSTLFPALRFTKN